MLIESGKYLNGDLINYIIHVDTCSHEIQVAMQISVLGDKIYEVQKQIIIIQLVQLLQYSYVLRA